MQVGPAGPTKFDVRSCSSVPGLCGLNYSYTWAAENVQCFYYEENSAFIEERCDGIVP